MREERPAPPNPQVTWIAGYWHWTGMQYAWIPGHWEAAPSGAVWSAPKVTSQDGRYIYGYDGTRAAYRGILVPLELTMADARVVRQPVQGGPVATLLRLPFDEVGGIAVRPDGRAIVSAVYTSRSDVWLVENFDASTRPSAGKQ